MLGVFLAFFIVISALTGVLLAWKKDVNIIQPPTQKGVSKSLETWKPIHELAALATKAFHKKYPEQIKNKVDRIDVRPSKGSAKVLFKKGYWEVQIDGTTGEIKSIAQRHSDWIEQLHDGSLIADWFKMLSMNVLGLGLIIMTATGFWLWYGPKKYRHLKKHNKL